MRTAATTIIATLLAVAAHAGESVGGYANRKVTVCMNGAIWPEVEAPATSLASRIFSGIGVTLEWRRGFSGCSSRSIMIRLTGDTPLTLRPGTLAYAQPYEGTHVRVFYDRITENYDKALIPRLMGHVLAHEITHNLEGLMRHSPYGVMKAHWGIEEYSQMRMKPLEFTDEDIRLIYRGLEIRNAQALTAQSVAAERLAAR